MAIAVLLACRIGNDRGDAGYVADIAYRLQAGMPPSQTVPSRHEPPFSAAAQAANGHA